jgi:DNA replicative helicase MCM subunit Mcm2 (Cdc46/Mcm family)
MYARERVRPKLYQVDQEKLSKLYAELRRESLATGSFPITVRHLESMIRMAEASAKMSLREYVRADDIDLAIEVAVNSFVNAQKMSIKKTLQRVCGDSERFLLITDSVSFIRVSGSTLLSRKTTKSCFRICLVRLSRIKHVSTCSSVVNSQS